MIVIKERLRKYPFYQQVRRFYWDQLVYGKKRFANKLRRWPRAATAPYYLMKLIIGVKNIQRMPIEQLRDRNVVEKVIAYVGVNYDGRTCYGDDMRHMNLGEGLLQVPRQLAQALCLLADQRIETAIEIGTWNGWTACVMAAYLSRFQNNFKLTTVDLRPCFKFYKIMRKLVPVEFMSYKTVVDVQDRSVDLCFIDGNHDYEFCKKDYDLLGRKTRVCMFHDINDQLVGFEHVPRLWREIKLAEQDRAEFHEFTYHSHNQPVMGIGIRVYKD